MNFSAESIIPPQIFAQHSGEKVTRNADFGPWLPTGVDLTGTPTAEEQSTSDLTISGVAINGDKVQFTVTGGNAGTHYKILVTVDLDNGDTYQMCCQLKIEDC